MAEILFRPTCSKCNKVICGPVDCKRVENEVMGKQLEAFIVIIK